MHLWRDTLISMNLFEHATKHSPEKMLCETKITCGGNELLVIQQKRGVVYFFYDFRGVEKSE